MYSARFLFMAARSCLLCEVCIAPLSGFNDTILLLYIYVTRLRVIMCRDPNLFHLLMYIFMQISDFITVFYIFFV